MTKKQLPGKNCRGQSCILLPGRLQAVAQVVQERQELLSANRPRCVGPQGATDIGLRLAVDGTDARNAKCLHAALGDFP